MVHCITVRVLFAVFVCRRELDWNQVFQFQRLVGDGTCRFVGRWCDLGGFSTLWSTVDEIRDTKNIPVCTRHNKHNDHKLSKFVCDVNPFQNKLHHSRA